MKPFCDLPATKDDKTVSVVLDGIANTLAKLAGTHEAEKNREAKEAEFTNGTEAEAKTEDAKETTEAAPEEDTKEDEATKRKAMLLPRMRDCYSPAPAP